MKDLRIVLADDHEVVRAGLCTLLNASPGLTVVGEARNGYEAITRALELEPDVLVMDISMPALNGVEATEMLARQCPAVRVIALTAHEDRGYLTRLLRAGASGYMLKRATPDEVIRAIRTVAEGGTYVDPLLAGTLLRRAAQSSGGHSDAADPLSDREEEVLRRIAWGGSNKEIATELGISTKTVETYKARITGKLGIRSRTEMVRYALQRGWLSAT